MKQDPRLVRHAHVGRRLAGWLRRFLAVAGALACSAVTAAELLPLVHFQQASLHLQGRPAQIAVDCLMSDSVGRGGGHDAGGSRDTACWQQTDRQGYVPTVMLNHPVKGVRVPVRSSSTAFAIARELVLTNYHAVNGCQRVEVLASGLSHAARIVSIDAANDLAALSVPGAALPPLAFDREPPQLGERVVVAGFPLANLLGGLRVSDGIVSALEGMGGDAGTMQISAPVQPGNSGGPVLNEYGRVAGVVVKKLVAPQTVENVAFAVRLPQTLDFLRRSRLLHDVRDDEVPMKSVAQVVKAAAASIAQVLCH